MNDYKTDLTDTIVGAVFYSCVILNDYKTQPHMIKNLTMFYSCVILNDYKTFEIPRD